MKSSIVASVHFDFKGTSHKAQTTIDANSLVDVDETQILDTIYGLIAKQNNIGLYSYELEVFMSEEIIFSKPTGYMQECFSDGVLNYHSIQSSYEASIINDIVKKYDLENNSNIKNALTEAYNKRQKKS